jgi:hypothetical protein
MGKGGGPAGARASVVVAGKVSAGLLWAMAVVKGIDPSPSPRSLQQPWCEGNWQSLETTVEMPLRRLLGAVRFGKPRTREPTGVQKSERKGSVDIRDQRPERGRAMAGGERIGTNGRANKETYPLEHCTYC